jgi:hypothetical protein
VPCSLCIGGAVWLAHWYVLQCDGLEARFRYFRDAVQGVLEQHGQDKNEAQALNSLRPLKYGYE